MSKWRNLKDEYLLSHLNKSNEIQLYVTISDMHYSVNITGWKNDCSRNWEKKQTLKQKA